MTSETLSQAASEQGVLYEEIGSFHALFCFEHIFPPQIVMDFACTSEKYFKAWNPNKEEKNLQKETTFILMYN